MSEMLDSTGFEDLVRIRAYALWESEGRPCGRDAEHWLMSEEQARRQLATSATPAAKAKPAARKKTGAAKRAA